jgi:hypothetical protein
MFQKSTQLSVFLENRPGELSKLAKTLGEKGINIIALSIQDPAEYIQRLFKAREQTSRRIASADSYRSILKEAAMLTLIRFITSEPDKSARVLAEAGYKIDTQEVIMAFLDNRPGQLAAISERFAKEKININYTYGSALDGASKSLFVFHVSDMGKALEALGG